MQPNGPPQMSLVEIGPRFVLTPIRIFEGAFGGATVFSNPGVLLRFHQATFCLMENRIYIACCRTYGAEARKRWQVQSAKRRRSGDTKKEGDAPSERR